MITVPPPMPRLYVSPTGDSSGKADTAAISAAINEIPTAGGTLVLLPGTYYLGTSGSSTAGVNMTSRSNIALVGEGGEWGGCTISYLGTGRAIDARGKDNNGLLFQGLTINSTTASTLLDLGNLSGNTTDASTSGTRLERVEFIGGKGGTPTLLRLSQALTTHVTDCAFNGGTYGVEGLDQAGAFSNSIQIRSCWFEYQKTAPIRNPGQNWLVDGCTFEPLNSGAACAVLCDGTAPFLDLTYLGNSHQDSTTTAGSAWLTLSGKGATIIGNTFIGHADNHVKTTSAGFDGLTIIGNTLENDDAHPVDISASTVVMFTMLGNYWNSANGVNGTPSTPSIWQTASNQLYQGGIPSVALSSNESTGTGSAALGSNCPATTPTAPHTWEKIVTSDGSTCYFPVWK